MRIFKVVLRVVALGLFLLWATFTTLNMRAMAEITEANFVQIQEVDDLVLYVGKTQIQTIAEVQRIDEKLNQIRRRLMF